MVDLPIAPENICVRRMVLKRDSEEEAAFLLSVSKGLSQLNFSSLDSTAGLDLLSEAISRLFADCWATYAKKNTVTTRSKEWWNNDCRTALVSYASPPVRKTTSPRWCHLRTLQARLPRRPPCLQHVLWWCCNLLDIPSSMAEILLFNSVFHDGVAPVSVSTLKPPLGAIGVLPLKPQASPILSVCI